uniref:Neuro_bHLH domain-containing protein n=1 Tax=Caenorhabditis japonica TaxID=281687 RepID=A0A8R1IT86_CAEJA
MLQTNEQPSPLEYAHTLANGLSQTTTNMLANLLQVQPRQLLPPNAQFDIFPPEASSHNSQQSSFSSASSNSSLSPPQYYYSPSQPSAAPLQAAIPHFQVGQQQHDLSRMYSHEMNFGYSP